MVGYVSTGVVVGVLNGVFAGVVVGVVVGTGSVLYGVDETVIS